MLASWVGMLPGTILYVYLGSLAQVATGETTIAQKVLYGVGLLATVVVTVWITRIARRALGAKLGTAEDQPVVAKAGPRSANQPELS